MGCLKGWLYCYLWYTSILAGYAGLFCPLFPVLLLSNKLYRYCTDALFTFWQYYPTALLELLCGCDIQVSGDAIRTNETSLLIMNHRTRTDWNFFWPTVYHCVTGRNRFKFPTKFVLKDIIRHIPGPGWVMQLACFVYIKRCWIFDKRTFERVIRYFGELDYKYSLLVFPEGTDFTESTKINSDHFATKHNLQKYDHVLHPRTTGFAFLTHQMLMRDSLDAVYDMTLIYPDLVPQNERAILNGMFPKEIKIHLVRYPQSVLPRTEEELSTFLQKRWSDKEKTIKEFNLTGQFLHGQILRTDNAAELYAALVFWTLLPYVVLFMFFYVGWFRNMVVGHTMLLILFNVLFDGFQSFEIGLHNLRRRMLWPTRR